MDSKDQQLLSIGRQCSHSACLLVDFLPFKCHHCEDSFCQEHFLVEAHSCPKYDEGKHNRVAPNCTSFRFFVIALYRLFLGPLCNTPVAIRPGQDPNIRMDDHLTNECSVMTGKSGRARTMPVCARGGCKKILFSPIRCDARHHCLAYRKLLIQSSLYRTAGINFAPRIDFLPTTVALLSPCRNLSLLRRSFCLAQQSRT